MNKKNLILIGSLFGLILASLFVNAIRVLAATPGIPISVPSATTSGYMLVSTDIGRYIGTTTDPAHFGSIFATSTATSTIIGGLTIGTLNVGTSSSATSTFQNGIQLVTGCYRLSTGLCAGGGFNSGTANRLAYYSTGNTIDSANNLTFDGTNLGIGTTNPFGLLDTSKANTGVTTGSNALVNIVNTQLADTVNFRTGINFRFANGILNSNSYIEAINETGGATSLAFAPATGGSGMERMRINSSGNVGIGTTTPGTILSIQGAANFVSSGTSTIHTGLTLPVINATSTTASSTFGGNAVQIGQGGVLSSAAIVMNTLIIPNGTNPSASTTGAIFLDTNRNMLGVATSSNNAAYLRTSPVRLFSFRVASTTTGVLSAGTLGLPSEFDPYRVEFIQCYVYGGTSEVISLIHSGGGTQTNTVTCLTTSTSTKLAITSNNTWSAGQGAGLLYGTVSGTVSELYVSIFGSWLKQ